MNVICSVSGGIAASVLLALSAPLQAADKPVQANDFINLFEKLSGKQPGIRKAHARGLCATGTFIPEQNAQFPSAPLLSGEELPVVMRFSVGGGNPGADERAPSTRGMAMQITLPGGSRHIFTGNNFPVFAGKDPQTFFGLLSTFLPDEQGNRDPQKTMQYAEENPSVKANLAWQQAAKTPASYANTDFYGLHTFFYALEDETPTKFRWHLVPDLGVKTLTEEQAQAKDNGFLAETIKQQLAESTVSYSLMATIGEPEDTNIDPSVQWPEDREQVRLGTVKLASAGGEQCTPINFDPNVLSAGFSPSDDPVLRMRSAAYAISFGKRLSGQ
ncbi:catalase family peroxidase [Lacimicrobium alkaliphilum]|uniref:Catalase-related peroxidase n=1 Tax=Lacimicrobium alkaliphilum TaxID=1526571 RepID=A0ABQ1R9U3_9ALTE|nr:catalase family peroxidase [Lacimicrobium alkaliphilum]GGD59849.1 catalase-related peroxidase [Lacimicrobium alkaliphilum]